VKAISRSLLAGVAALLLGGCLNVETRIELNDDYSGLLKLRYEMENELWELGVFDPESSVRAIPVSEADFRRAARRVDGVELRRYRRAVGEATTRIEAELAFRDLESLNAVYAPGERLIRTGERDGGAVYRQRFAPAGGRGLEDEEFLEAYFADYEIVFEVTTPGDIVSANFGNVVDGGRTARVSLDIVEFLTGSESVEWEIRY
jgi:hypothetical protein